MVTPIYPGPGVGDNFTKVVHYFAREMAAAGHRICVVAVPSYFPRWMYHIPQPVVRIVLSRFGSVPPKERLDRKLVYDYEGINVIRVPLFKIQPWAKISDNVMKKASEDIVSELERKGFVPDVIAAHWFDPSVYFVNSLKRHFGCKASLVVHNHGFKFREYADAPDIWGCRKIDTREIFKREFPGKTISFRCCSGIPEMYLESTKERDWSGCDRFIYVGTLIQRKYPDVVIGALSDAREEFTLNIVGEGVMKGKLEKEIDKLGVRDKVKLRGRLKRERIIELLDESDVFIMISEDEVFGLVYLEAMARGCIVVAASNEGMEGIIRSGENGFLVPAGDRERLTDTVRNIRSLSPEKRTLISQAARKTAEEFTERKVAAAYLGHLKQLTDS